MATNKVATGISDCSTTGTEYARMTDVTCSTGYQKTLNTAASAG
jgi:hypothetical protein